MSAPGGSGWMQRMDTPELRPYFSSRPGSSGQGSRPGTSGSTTSNGSIGAMLTRFTEQELANLPSEPAPEDPLFQLPMDDFNMSLAADTLASIIDPAMLGGGGMDYQMQDQSQMQQPCEYPDKGLHGTQQQQPFYGAKDLPQVHGTMDATAGLGPWPSPAAEHEVQNYFQHLHPQQGPDSNMFVQQEEFMIHPNHAMPSIEYDGSYYQPADQSLDFGDEDDQEYNAPSKRRKTSQTTTKIVKKYNAEAPKKTPGKPWLRQNYSTKGNTRTGKLNNFGHGEYASRTEHPLGMTQWSSSANRFAYNEWGELHGVCFPAAQVQDYLYSHPFNRPNHTGQGKLILWIQKMAGDTTKRSETQNSFSCRIKECPANIYKKRTITTGHYRVAFDEQWDVYGDHRNPLICAGYAHLYCMERFFDFRQICRDLDVRADDREIEREPTGTWTAGLGQKTEEFHAANSFIKFCKQGKNPKTWADYPQHDPTHPKRQKMPHSATLSHKLVQAKTDVTGASKMRMMLNRDRTATQFFVNMGDLQMQIDAQQEKAQRRRGGTVATKRKRRAKAYDSDEELSDDEEVTADNAQTQSAPIANMNRRTTRASTRMSASQSAHVEPVVVEPAPPEEQFSFTSAPPATGAERTTSLNSLFGNSEEVQVSPKTVPDDVVDPALTDMVTEPATEGQDKERKASDQTTGVNSLGFFAARRK